MVDKRPFGGTCALRGCDPKKVLVSAAAAVDAACALTDKGVRPGGLALDWPALMRFKRTFTDPVAANRRAALVRSGIDTFDGAARFVGPTRLSVNDGAMPMGIAADAVAPRPSSAAICWTAPISGYNVPSLLQLDCEELQSHTPTRTRLQVQMMTERL
jgi:glutathione reductase (NADPH)